jgi:hypothetical protein
MKNNDRVKLKDGSVGKVVRTFTDSEGAKVRVQKSDKSTEELLISEVELIEDKKD